MRQAVRYLLQLAIEWETDAAAYENGVELLKDVVTELNGHRARREALKRKSQLAELVQPIMERLRTENPGLWSGTTCATISRWLLRRGIHQTPTEVEALLSQPVRRGARSRTRREQLLDKLAQLAGASQSDFEKLVTVVEHGKGKEGRLGNALLHERAARDRAPSVTEMLLYALLALDIDETTGQQIAKLMPWGGLEDDVEDRRTAAEIWLAGSRLAEERAHERGKADSPTPASAKDPHQGTRNQGRRHAKGGARTEHDRRKNADGNRGKGKS